MNDMIWTLDCLGTLIRGIGKIRKTLSRNPFMDQMSFFHFTLNNIRYCVDATKENSYGKFVHSSSQMSNCTPFKLACPKSKNPKIFFYSTKDIKRGEEIIFDYIL